MNAVYSLVQYLMLPFYVLLGPKIFYLSFAASIYSICNDAAIISGYKTYIDWKSVVTELLKLRKGMLEA
jgi:hypothetical protein